MNQDPVIVIAPATYQPFWLWRHLNKLRWFCLSTVFAMLILLPMLSLYQNYVAAHAYKHLTSAERVLFDTMALISSPFVNDPEHDLDLIKGTTWSGQLFGLKLSDPLAVVNQMAAGLEIYWPFVLTALIPIVATLIFGRFFCGWICPATFVYELNSNLAVLINKTMTQWGLHIDLSTRQRRFSKQIKYGLLALLLALSTYTGTILMASFYPPAIIGRELYFSIALSGFSSGTLFFIATLLFDLLVTRRGFCRYVCPGGALYSLLGRYRLVRIKRLVTSCNDCGKCNAVCEFDRDPLRDDFGQECNNCTACIAVCPKDALTLTLAIKDQANQGCGHQSKAYRHQHSDPDIIPIKVI